MDVFLVNLMLVFCAAVVFGVIFRYLGLPSVVGHVLAGFVIGLTGFVGVTSVQGMHFLGSLGITLLLFLVGLEMNPTEIKKVGGMVVKIFVTQTILLGFIFYLFAIGILGFSWSTGVMLAVALSFSSTIVVVKMLSERRDLASLSGKVSLGLLLLQDLLAIVILVLLPGLEGGFSWMNILNLLVKLGVLLLVINLIGHYILGFIEKNLIKAGEDLVLLSLVWFSLAVYLAVNILHLTPEIGALLAGLSLSTSWGHFQIVSKVKTLRDIFLTIFFVILGFEIGLGAVNWWLVVELTFLVMVGKFLVTELTCRWAKLSGKVAFSVGINMTQLSEFSLVVMAVGYSVHLWSNQVLTAVTVASLLTMLFSTILISWSAAFYKMVAKKWPGFFAYKSAGRVEMADWKNHVVLLGGDRTGRSILSFLKKNGEKVLVVDFNPQVIGNMEKRGDRAVFADASDPDVLELTNMREAKMIISTVKDVDDSLALLTELKLKNVKVPTIVDAETALEARELYEAGATYVIFPHFVSGWHLGQLMKKFENDVDTLKKYRSNQDETMKEIYDGEY